LVNFAAPSWRSAAADFLAGRTKTNCLPLPHPAPPFPNGVGRTAAEAAGAALAGDPKASNDGRVLRRWRRRRMGLMGRIEAGLE
jgi:hypothetical protein